MPDKIMTIRERKAEQGRGEAVEVPQPSAPENEFTKSTVNALLTMNAPAPGAHQGIVMAKVTGRPKIEGEKKKSVSISVRPSVLNATKEIAYLQRTDVSKLIHDFLENYVRENIDLLKTDKYYYHIEHSGTVVKVLWMEQDK